jgi:nucleolar protein 14
MGKRKTHSRRSLGSLPKGLPVRGKGSGNDGNNPFEVTQRTKKAKFDVHNRGTANQMQQQQQTNNRPSALALALQKRKTFLKEAIQQSKKSNIFADRRIGEYDSRMTDDEQNLARLVRERTSRSKKISKYSLEDDDDDHQHTLTHRGKSIDTMTSHDHVILSDDDEDDKGNLDATDTLLHFGGGNLEKERQKKMKASEMTMYGPTGGLTDGTNSSNLAGQYGDPNRKIELEDLIMRRKLMKAERLKTKDEQVSKFEQLDESFSELANMLSFRDKGKEARQQFEQKKAGKILEQEEDDFDEWDKEMKQYLYSTTKKAKAADRTKTPEEIAKEEHDRLHELETRRLARMNGDFDNDNFDDIDSASENDDSDDDDESKPTKTKKSKYSKKKSTGLSNSNDVNHPEALDNESDQDDESDSEALKTMFTADGLVQIDKNGKVVGKVGEITAAKHKRIRDNHRTQDSLLSVGMKVSACYHANEQYLKDDSIDGDGQISASWYSGTISKVNNVDSDDLDVTYNIDYDDGDYEDNVERIHLKILDRTDDEIEEDTTKRSKEVVLKKKRQLARDKARYVVCSFSVALVF